jgi:hypothetical protein
MKHVSVYAQAFARGLCQTRMLPTDMDIKLERVTRWVDRDAELAYAAEVIDDVGMRYPIRISVQSALATSVRHHLGVTRLTPVAEACYRQVIAGLVASQRLRPGRGVVNTIYLVKDAHDIRDGDIVMPNGEELLLAAGRSQAWYHRPASGKAPRWAVALCPAHAEMFQPHGFAPGDGLRSDARRSPPRGCEACADPGLIDEVARCTCVEDGSGCHAHRW